MPCNNENITKNNKCDKNNCLCLSTKGSYICLCENEMSENDCKCERNLCKCGDKCTCVNTAGYSCICVCRDEQGKIRTCIGCSCKPKRVGVFYEGKNAPGNCGCKGHDEKGGNSCICVCSNEKGNTNTCGACSCMPVKVCKSKSVKICESKCDNDKCTCLSTGGSSCICVCSNEKGNIKTCEGCSCVPEQSAAVSCKGKSVTENCGCKCDDENCACLSLGGDSCSCMCHDEKGNIKTCGGCVCKPSFVSCKRTYAQGVKISNDGASQPCKCQGNARCCVCVCKNEQGETACCDNCNCDENNRCDKKGCTCAPKESNIDAGKYVKKCVRFENNNSHICVCENQQGKLVCCVDCTCGNTNTCDKKGCACISKVSNVSNQTKSTETAAQKCCNCICKNDQEELVCCDDCKCDDNGTCDKKGCACVPKGSTTCIKAASSKTDCFCKTSPVSCVCVCKNEQGELVCCDDCKCDDNSTCVKKGCVCVPKGSTTCIKAASSKTDCFCKTSPVPCVCVCKNEQGELICCDDCMCDDNIKCDKTGCACVPKGSSTCIKAASSKTDCFCKTSPVSCVCVCKNEQGELVCCDDCKCDNEKSCDKQGCACVAKESVTCESGCSCTSKGCNTGTCKM